MKKFVVMMLDPNRTPRAWGVGRNKDIAIKIAHAQLNNYKARKMETNDPLARASYTELIKEVDLK